jgi:nucleotide-binding universal stress UspA family protein
VKDIRKIVTGIDLSPYSSSVLEYAGIISEGTGAEIVTVNVIDRNLVDSVENVFVREGRPFSGKRFLSDETYRRTQSMRELLEHSLPRHVPRRMIIRSGIPFTEVLRVVDEEHADLLIISAKGATDQKRHLLGSTCEKLFRHAPVSILVLHSRS